MYCVVNDVIVEDGGVTIPLASPNLQPLFDPATSTCLALSDHSPPAPWPRTSPRLDTISLHHLYLSPTATGSYAATIRSSHHHDEPPPAFRSDYHPFQAPLSHPKIHSNPRNVTGRRVNHGPSPPLLHSHPATTAPPPPATIPRTTTFTFTSIIYALFQITFTCIIYASFQNPTSVPLLAFDITDT
ncbi:hypothetical protein L2E82_35749 [Cichorium intybus]|uniref:Uncharacterized protein n=1 Tax=Cichorium intybus TaxID=13427 RepID=A0ACB9BPS9_CICIN|nr:hypothetical protein L2E82_35749 [Cichorium intybus]